MKSTLPILLFAILACTFLNCTQQTKTQVKVFPFADSLNIQLSALVEESTIPGFAAAIVSKDQVVYAQGFGYADQANSRPFTTNTSNFIASISKTFIGVAVMQLVDQGKLDLDAPINSILPYKIVNPFYPDVDITVRHLVNHTSTMEDDFDPEEVGEAPWVLLEEIEYKNDSIQDFMDDELSYYRLGKKITLEEYVKKYTLPDQNWYSTGNFYERPPGAQYSYSNLGAAAAADIVAKVSGMPFDKYTDEYIFKPLGMNNTSWNYEDMDPALISEIYIPDSWDDPTMAIEHPRIYDCGWPVGSLQTSAVDITKYLMEMIKGYSGSGKLMNADAYQTMLNPQLMAEYFETRNEDAFDDEYNVGVFWAISAPGLRLHKGGSIGVYSMIYFDPKTETGAFAFCNMPIGDFGEMLNVVYEYERKFARLE